MNYLRSIEYKDDKDLLSGEYKAAYLTIENYYIQVYTEESYEVQLSLKEILKNFLSAQEAKRPIEMITGPDIKKYAIDFIEAKYKANKGLIYWLTTLVEMVWIILFMMFLQALNSEANSNYSFVEKMNHIYFSGKLFISFLIVIIISCPLYNIRLKITKCFYYRPGLMKAIRFAFTFIMILLLQYLSKLTIFYNYALSLRIPLSLYLMATFITTAYLLATGLISYRKTKAKKRALVIDGYSKE